MKKFILGLMLGLFAVTATGLSFADELVASKGGDSYHLATCPVVKNIKAENKVTFGSPEDAIKAGYKACKKCNSPEKSTTANFVASKDSDKYHTPACRLAKNIKAENKIGFATKEEAEKANYKPCAICFPQAKKEASKAVKKAEVKK